MRFNALQCPSVLLCASVLSLGAGCAAFRADTTELDVEEPAHMDQRFDYTDLRRVTESVVDELLEQEWVADAAAPPVVSVAGLQNRTGEYVDMKNITDRMRNLLIRSGKVTFVNTERREDLLKEQDYQAQHAKPETRAASGRQEGAGYMLTGSLTEMRQTSPRQVRVSRQKVSYYKFTVELTDLVAGTIVWSTEREFARKLSEPLIGW